MYILLQILVLVLCVDAAVLLRKPRSHLTANAPLEITAIFSDKTSPLRRLPTTAYDDDGDLLPDEDTNEVVVVNIHIHEREVLLAVGNFTLKGDADTWVAAATYENGEWQPLHRMQMRQSFASSTGTGASSAAGSSSMSASRSSAGERHYVPGIVNDVVVQYRDGDSDKTRSRRGLAHDTDNDTDPDNDNDDENDNGDGGTGDDDSAQREEKQHIRKARLFDCHWWRQRQHQPFRILCPVPFLAEPTNILSRPIRLRSHQCTNRVLQCRYAAIRPRKRCKYR